MSKNHSSEEDAEHKIYLDGKYIPVSKEVYLAYHESARKIRYFQEDLKAEKLVVDQENRRVTFVPSREDSLERLTENLRQELPLQSRRRKNCSSADVETRNSGTQYRRSRQSSLSSLQRSSGTEKHCGLSLTRLVFR